MERLTRVDEDGTVLCIGCVEEKECNGDCLSCQHDIDAIDKLAEYEDAEEQGFLLRLPCKIGDVIDVLFSHNEIISLWIKVKEETSYHLLLWNGMAWNIPEELKSCDFVKIFGTIPEKITHADFINIEVVLNKEAEQALERMEKE